MIPPQCKYITDLKIRLKKLFYRREERDIWYVMHNLEVNKGQVPTDWLINTLCGWNVKNNIYTV